MVKLLFIKTPGRDALSEMLREESGDREVGVNRFTYTVPVICKEKKSCIFFRIYEKE